MRLIKKVSALLFTIVTLGVVPAFAETVTIPNGSVVVPNGPKTGAAGVSFVLSGSVSATDTLVFIASGVAYEQNSSANDSGTPLYGTNAAGVIVVPGLPGDPPGDTTGNAISCGTDDCGSLVVSLNGGSPVQVFPANSSNGLGSADPPQTLSFNAPLSSLFGNFGTIKNPKLTFIVYDSDYSNNSGSFVLAAPVPSISSLQPDSLDAGSDTFDLTVNGSKFVSDDTVDWNGIPLTTTFVSSSKLTAKVSAAEVEAAGSAAVTVVDGSKASNSALFAIPLTSIVIKSQSIKTAATGYSITLTLSNSGVDAATDISLTGAYLATSPTSTSLPVDIASIAAGGTKTVTLSFPSSAGKAGEQEYLLLYGSYAGGGISLSSLVTFP
jgi:hypothetical protein